jgi:phage terminase small subunit
MAKGDKLTERQERFALEWLIDCNAQNAAIRAGYSERGAHVQGHHLLRNPKVRRRIRELQRGRAKRLQITADRVMNEYAKIAFSDIGDVASWTEKGVNFIPSRDMKKGARQTIAEISSKTEKFISDSGETETTTLKVKLYPKLPALDKLALHLGITPDNEADTDADSETTIEEMVRSTFGEAGEDGVEGVGT